MLPPNSLSEFSLISIIPFSALTENESQSLRGSVKSFYGLSEQKRLQPGCLSGVFPGISRVQKVMGETWDGLSMRILL